MPAVHGTHISTLLQMTAARPLSEDWRLACIAGLLWDDLGWTILHQDSQRQMYFVPVMESDWSKGCDSQPKRKTKQVPELPYSSSWSWNLVSFDCPLQLSSLQDMDVSKIIEPRGQMQPMECLAQKVLSLICIDHTSSQPPLFAEDDTSNYSSKLLSMGVLGNWIIRMWGHTTRIDH